MKMRSLGAIAAAVVMWIAATLPAAAQVTTATVSEEAAGGQLPATSYQLSAPARVSALEAGSWKPEAGS
jgi:hypothetical protein